MMHFDSPKSLSNWSEMVKACKLRQYSHNILMTVLPKKIPVLFPHPLRGLKTVSYCFMRLLNTNKEMPKTVREYSIFKKLRWEKKGVVICQIFKLLLYLQEKNNNCYCLGHCRLEEQGKGICCYSLF